MWLNKRDLDIRCIRLVPYRDGGRVLIDVQQVVPLPEAADYQIQIREKEQKERRERAERFPLRKFWESLLALGEGRATLHAKMSPSEGSYIGTSAGVSGLNFFYVVGKHDSRVEVYIDRGDVTVNKRIFDELHSHKDEIEAAFGGPLLWQRLETKRACRIAYEMTIGGKDDEANWQAIQITMVDAMIRFEKALSPFIAKLTHLK
jgi:hypothetical protein